MDSSAQRQVLADTTQRNAEEIRALGMVDRFGALWARVNERYLRENIRATDVHAILRPGVHALSSPAFRDGPHRDHAGSSHYEGSSNLPVQMPR